MECAFARRTTRWILKPIVALVFAQILCGPMSVALADQTQPDPAGTATGDRSSAADAAGNPFVVPAPTDPSAPDYAKARKITTNIRRRRRKEPLALKLADDVGHTAHRDEFFLDAAHRISGAVHAGGICAADVRAGAQEKCRAPDDAELRGVRVCLPCLLRRGLCVSVWRGRGQCGSGESGRRAHSQSLPDWQRPVGISWAAKDFF